MTNLSVVGDVPPQPTDEASLVMVTWNPGCLFFVWLTDDLTLRHSGEKKCQMRLFVLFQLRTQTIDAQIKKKNGCRVKRRALPLDRS
jgi:hypothetical protein